MAARALQLREALSRCDNSGGEGPACPQDTLLSGEMQTEVHLTNAELKQLQLRMIALENLVTALLAEASERQLDLAGVLAAYIAPKQGFTPYHLTIHAARHMKHPPSERAQGDAACAVRVTTSPCIRELHGNSSGDSKTTRSTKDRQNPAIEVNQWPDSAGLL